MPGPERFPTGEAQVDKPPRQVDPYTPPRRSLSAEQLQRLGKMTVRRPLQESRAREPLGKTALRRQLQESQAGDMALRETVQNPDRAEGSRAHRGLPERETSSQNRGLDRETSREERGR